MKKLNWLLIIGLGIWAVIGWQQANSLSQGLVVKDITIGNLMVSVKQAQNKPPDIVVIEKPVEKIIYQTAYLSIDRFIIITLSTYQGNIDLDYLLDKVEYGIYSHRYFALNPTPRAGSVEYNLEWVEIYEQFKAIILEIKERK